MVQRKKNLRKDDPNLKREQEKYGNALPSREWIVEILEKNGVPLSQDELARQLSIKKASGNFLLIA